MKKLALAPVVALAITGLAASPVIAAPSTDAFGQTNVQAPKSAGQPDATDAPTAPAKLDASVSVSPETISQTDLVEKGVTLTVTNLEAGDTVTDDATGETVTAEGDTVSYEIYNITGDPKAIPEGPIEFTVTVKRGEQSQTFDEKFTVTADETEEPTAPAVDPKASLVADEITVSEFEGEGLKFSGEGFTPNGTVSVEGQALPAQVAKQAEEQLKADENGKVTGTVVAPKDSVKPGKYTVTFIDDESGEKTEPQEFTVVEDATETPTTPAAEAKLTVSPESVTPKDFVQKDKGVKLVVENCEPGEDVRFVVNPKGNSSVTAFDETEKADDEGNASVTVYGTSASNPSAYIGDYDVTVTCGDDELTGKFSVEEDPNAGGSDGNDDGGSDGGNGGGNGGGDLPRTGMELTGLAAGAGLLLVGGTAIFLTKRRKKGVPSPSDI
ncbi:MULTISPECIES: LPXTG cell wall anchor domain-containing protein [unclassified Brevibacterium]|uniref:LPXTG cell wall anchor domain-containing protein n=1 Tax=unclassified Brevibacterium TaxID=2614124 RepID=UPI00362D919B